MNDREEQIRRKYNLPPPPEPYQPLDPEVINQAMVRVQRRASWMTVLFTIPAAAVGVIGYLAAMDGVVIALAVMSVAELTRWALLRRWRVPPCCVSAGESCRAAEHHEKKDS